MLQAAASNKHKRYCHSIAVDATPQTHSAVYVNNNNNYRHFRILAVIKMVGIVFPLIGHFTLHYIVKDRFH